MMIDIFMVVMANKANVKKLNIKFDWVMGDKIWGNTCELKK